MILESGVRYWDRTSTGTGRFPPGAGSSSTLKGDLAADLLQMQRGAIGDTTACCSPGDRKELVPRVGFEPTAYRLRSGSSSATRGDAERYFGDDCSLSPCISPHLMRHRATLSDTTRHGHLVPRCCPRSK